MSTLMENRIEAAKADSDKHTVTLQWRDGSQTVVRLGHLIGHAVYERLSDPEFFRRVSPQRDGRALAWPGSPEDRIEMCADALWLEAHPEDAPKELMPFFPLRKGQKHPHP